MKKCPDTVTMRLLKANMVSLEGEHVTKSMQGLSSACGNTFVQIVTLTDAKIFSVDVKEKSKHSDKNE
jgi:hypothetical protein